MTTVDIKSIAKNHVKKIYGNNVKIGSITKEQWTESSDIYLEKFCTMLRKICTEQVTLEGVENYISSFDFQNKVYFKHTPCIIIKSESFRLVFNPYGKSGVELYKIHVFKKGTGMGTMIMNLINHISKEENITVYLRPVAFDGTSIEKLRDWYSRNGFKRCSNSLYWSNK